jgi:glucan phosphoethanolaminetransferase (alkaline phosphatase superfamily)
LRTLSDHQIRQAAFGFTLVLFIFEVYVVGVDYSKYFAYLVDSETIFWGALAVACLLASFYLFFRLICFVLAASWPYKVVCLIIFTASLVVEYGYQKALGRFSDKIDLETAIAATPDQQTAAAMMYLDLWFIAPCLLLLALAVVIRGEKKLNLRAFLLSFFPLAVAFAMFPTVVDQKFPTLATAAFVRTNMDLLVNGPVTNGRWAAMATGVELRRRAVAQPPLPAGYRPSNNVVVLVDESMMGDHFSLNGYARETTPILDKLKKQGLLHNWGIAAAASTGSRYTYAALITGLTPDDFPDKTDFKANTFPTLFQYAQAMGYRTYFFDGQMNGYWGGIADDKNYFDEWQGVLDISDHQEFKPYELDAMMAKKIRNVIYSSTGNFIFAFKHGAHIPYSKNFPPDEAKWTPSYETDNKYDIPPPDMLAAAANAYDNAIRYNVDSFFAGLVDDYSDLPNGTLIVYTGDHGQTLFVNGRASHGGNTKGEATVPLFIIGKLPAVDTGYKASHANIYPTVLDLLGYPDELRDTRGMPSLLRARAADSRPRYFNPDLGTKVPFD